MSPNLRGKQFLWFTPSTLWEARSLPPAVSLSLVSFSKAPVENESHAVLPGQLRAIDWPSFLLAVSGAVPEPLSVCSKWKTATDQFSSGLSPRCMSQPILPKSLEWGIKPQPNKKQSGSWFPICHVCAQPPQEHEGKIHSQGRTRFGYP